MRPAISRATTRSGHTASAHYNSVELPPWAPTEELDYLDRPSWWLDHH
jgi:hypothetical protein